MAVFSERFSVFDCMGIMAEKACGCKLACWECRRVPVITDMKGNTLKTFLFLKHLPGLQTNPIRLGIKSARTKINYFRLFLWVS